MVPSKEGRGGPGTRGGVGAPAPGQAGAKAGENPPKKPKNTLHVAKYLFGDMLSIFTKSPQTLINTGFSGILQSEYRYFVVVIPDHYRHCVDY